MTQADLDDPGRHHGRRVPRRRCVEFLRRSELVADSCGLTPQRYLLLLMIKGASDGSGRSTVTELAEQLQLAQSTVTELVARSVDAGLIEREGSASDGRVTYLRLTEEGERRLACSFTGLAERGAVRGDRRPAPPAYRQGKAGAEAAPVLACSGAVTAEPVR